MMRCDKRDTLYLPLAKPIASSSLPTWSHGQFSHITPLSLLPIPPFPPLAIVSCTVTCSSYGARDSRLQMLLAYRGCRLFRNLSMGWICCFNFTYPPLPSPVRGSLFPIPQTWFYGFYFLAMPSGLMFIPLTLSCERTRLLYVQKDSLKTRLDCCMDCILEARFCPGVEEVWASADQEGLT